MKTKLLAFSAAFLLVCLTFPLAFPHSTISDGESTLETAFLKYEVRDVFVSELKHTIQITNPRQTPIEGGKLIVPLVRNQSGRHYAVLFNVSVIGESFHGPTFLNYDSGNVYICWSDITINPGKNFTVNLSYLILSFSVKNSVNSSMLREYDTDSELYRKYTQPEKFIQSNHPEIIAVAHEIAASGRDPHEKALAIYNFVVNHLRYEVQNEEKGALWALNEGVGDCSEYSYLFVALCRAAGIPARIQAGFAFHYDNEILEDGHMWAEYYLEDYGWIPVDAAWRMFDHIDHRHLSSIQSMPEIPYANYVFNQTIGRQPIDKQKVQLKTVSVSRFYDSQFAEKVFLAVQRIRQMEFGVWLAKLLGAGLLFPSEMKKVELEILESKICIQNAVNSWEKNPTTAAYNASNAFDKTEETLKNTWTVVAKAFILYIGVCLILIVAAAVFLKRGSQASPAAQFI